MFSGVLSLRSRAGLKYTERNSFSCVVFLNNFKLVIETHSQGRLSDLGSVLSGGGKCFTEDFFGICRAAYDTSAPNAKRKYPDEGEADEEEIEEYKVRKKGKCYISLVFICL